MKTLQNSLQGLRVLNTRPKEQGSALSQAIHEAGGIALDLPAVVIEPSSLHWMATLPDLTTINHAIFISANAVNYCLNPLKKNQITWPESIQVTAVGKATALALTSQGIRVDHVPTTANSEHLLALDVMQQVNKQIILLVKGEGGRSLIADTLLQRGAELISLAVYRRVLPRNNHQVINSLWHDNALDIILFTSQQGMHNVFALFGDAARPWLCSKPCVVISERLANMASELGMKTIIVTRPDTIMDALRSQTKD